MLEGELIYAENGDIRQANSLVSKASEVFRNLRFKLLENESAIMMKKISLKDEVYYLRILFKLKGNSKIANMQNHR